MHPFFTPLDKAGRALSLLQRLAQMDAQERAESAIRNPFTPEDVEMLHACGIAV